jgi:DNA-binding response OmpR family regulator
VVLDIGLPQMDGLSVLEEWRRAGKSMPVLLLTARDRWSDKVAAAAIVMRMVRIMFMRPHLGAIR